MKIWRVTITYLKPNGTHECADMNVYASSSKEAITVALNELPESHAIWQALEWRKVYAGIEQSAFVLKQRGQ